MTPEEIIASALDLSLSTSDGKTPESWNCALFFWTDQSRHFYFVSSCDSRHMKNISKNPEVSVAIFHSKARQGIQFKGTGKILNEYNEIQKAIYWGLIKRFPESKVTIAQKRLEYEQTNRKIVQIEVGKEGIFMNKRIPSDANGNPEFYVDVRVKVDIPKDIHLISYTKLSKI